jgi:hypothetical protein
MDVASNIINQQGAFGSLVFLSWKVLNSGWLTMAPRYVTLGVLIRGSGEGEFGLESLVFSLFHSPMTVGMSL